ncbi:MAG: arginine deiminase [Bacillota bacterium]|nr:arginine deiminase [Bacillota bacterium]
MQTRAGEAAGRGDRVGRLDVRSEIGRLELVMVHRPGREIENLTPERLHALLFEDIPYLPAMRREHDAFVRVLRRHGVRVLYVEELLAEVLAEAEVRRPFIRAFLRESGYPLDDPWQEEARLLADHLGELPAAELVEALVGGVRRSELPALSRRRLVDLLEPSTPFVLEPLPNLYFMRDPAAVVGGGVLVSRMASEARRRESLLLEAVVRHHPLFARGEVPRWYERDLPYPVEGGDILVLSPETVAIGMGERTGARAVETVAARLFAAGVAGRVLAVELPRHRAFMHLDTVLTVVAPRQVAVHQVVVERGLRVFTLLPGRDGRPEVARVEGLRKALEREVGGGVDLIPTGGNDPVASAREQWNDGANTLALEPGRIVAYERNEISNRELERHGVRVEVIPGGELSRGRGGPRCMTMPLRRAPL